MSWRTYLAIRICRVLPPSLGYRAHYRLFSHLDGSSETFDERVLFGPGRIAGTMREAAEATFALHRTNAYQGMVLARATIDRGDIVFELGANSGTETLALANLVGPSGKVVAVEADPRTVDILKQRLVGNHVMNVDLIEQAIAGTAGTVFFHAGPHTRVGTSFTASSPIAKDAIEVQSTTVDELAERSGPPKFIWMDLEGSEYCALAGGHETLKTARPVIFSEVSNVYLRRAGASLEQLLALLSAAGYEVMDARRWFTPRLSVDYYGENLVTDCVFLPEEKKHLYPLIRRQMLRARLFPMLPFVHPLLR